MALAAYGTQVAGYAAGALTKALLDKAASEIGDNFTFANVSSVLSRLAPGKRNKGVRNAARARLMGRARGQLALMNAPVARNIGVRKLAPRFRSAQGKYVIVNREYVGIVISGADTATQLYTCQTYPIQPGMPTMFPWLSQVASTHQKYRFTKLVFTYVPVASTATVGRITMVYAVDPLDEMPTSKSELFQYPTSTEGSVWSPMTMNVDCSKAPLLFTRIGLIVDSDVKTYDFGQLFIASSNTGVSSTVMGEIFVEYELELITPKPAECAAADTSYFGTFAAATPFGNSIIYLAGGVWTTLGNKLKFPASGTYHVTYSVNGTAVGTIALNMPPADGGAVIYHNMATATTRAMNAVVRVYNGGAEVTFALAGTWTAVSSQRLIITPMTPSFQNVTTT